MDPEANHDSGTTDRKRPVVRRIALVISFIFLGITLTIVALNALFHRLRSQLPTVSPPDLNQCTRIEVRRLPDGHEIPPWANQAEKDLLTAEEVQHIEAVYRYTLDDPKSIAAFAQMIASGSYDGVMTGSVAMKGFVDILCHIPGKLPERHVAYGPGCLVTQARLRFDYDPPLDVYAKISSQVLSSELLPKIKQRISCGRQLESLCPLLKRPGNQGAYPPPSKWCDSVIDRNIRQGGTEKEAMGYLFCPAITRARGKSNYAINPACEPNSPADTVLLFETRVGWNQYGGPELFSFDNHDPRGGCVLLNNGTLRFVRTEEELGQLRWK